MVQRFGQKQSSQRRPLSDEAAERMVEVQNVSILERTEIPYRAQLSR